MKSLLEKDFHRTIRSEFPYEVEKLREISIPVDNHIKLAATIWMPKSRICLFSNSVGNKCFFFLL